MYHSKAEAKFAEVDKVSLSSSETIPIIVVTISGSDVDGGFFICIQNNNVHSEYHVILLQSTVVINDTCCIEREIESFGVCCKLIPKTLILLQLKYKCTV